MAAHRVDGSFSPLIAVRHTEMPGEEAVKTAS